jgi:nucleoside-diphosphate-sugar epimerase
MKVLVTGATGVYGRSVVERLHRAGHEVVAMARNPPRSLPPGVRFAAADVQDLAAVQAAMEGCDVVVHMAFVVTPIKDREQSRAISVGGTQNVVDAVKSSGARRLVFVSSAMSYGANPDNPPLFTESHVQRPAADYVYGTDKVAAERAILDSGIDAVIARTAVTVGRNIDNLLVDIFAGPAIMGIKGVDIRYQLVHQDDVGRFIAYATENGPAGPVNVAPPDFLPLREIAQILGKRYVEVSESQALKGVEFAWKHDLMDITPGEAAGISYLPRMDTTRLRQEWGFECAWTTAESVLDLRRAVSGLVSVAQRRVELPWRVRYPQQRPGELVDGEQRLSAPSAVEQPGELDTQVALAHPTYRAATTSRAPLNALTIDVHAHLLRAAALGLLDAFGMPAGERDKLSALGAGVFGQRLYVNTDVVAYPGGASTLRRRMLAAGYPREVGNLAAGSASTFARAAGAHDQSDAQLDATLSMLRDELAWLWAAVATGELLDGEQLGALDPLVTSLPDGEALGSADSAAVAAPTRCGLAAVTARRTAVALGQTVAACVRERAARLAAAGVLSDAADAGHLTWDELLDPPADVDAVIERRRAELERLGDTNVPLTVSAIGPDSAVKTTTAPREKEPYERVGPRSR